MNSLSIALSGTASVDSILSKYFMNMSIGNMKACSKGSDCFHKLSVSMNNKHIGSIDGTLSFVDKFKGINDIIIAFGIGAFPVTLF